MDTRQRWRKRRPMEEGATGVMTLLPDWLAAFARKRSTKLRMRVAVSLVTGLLVLYVITSRAAPPSGSKEKLYKQRLNERTRRKPVSAAENKMADFRPQAPRLMGPPQMNKQSRHVPPGFVGVGGGSKVLQPPPGPALAGDRSRLGLEDHPNPRLRIGEAQGSRRFYNVGPPGQSHAMHLVDGATDSGSSNKKPVEGVIVAPVVDSQAAAGSHMTGTQSAQNPTNVKLPRYVHLDLKVGPPKLSYLVQIFPILKSLGANGVILDYEDNFPFKGDLASLASAKAYTSQELQRIVSAARENNLDIIPLVQTFSNTEFILKQKQFQYLQERPDFLQNLNPARNETLTLVGVMVEQVLSAHPGVRYVHVGCEEVYHMGYSPETKAFLQHPENKMADLYLKYVTSVANLVRTRHPEMRVIIWDNVVRSIGAERLKRSGIGSVVEPMISMPSLDVTLSADTVMKYTDSFPNLWVGTTFNKPMASIALAPSFYRYISHQRSWLEKLKDLKNIRGVALVGSSRTSHFAPVAAILLPVALPSLGLCLRTLVTGEFNRSTFNDVTSVLGCTQRQPINAEDLWPAFSQCTFPGSSLFSDVAEVHQGVLHMKQIINTQGQKDVSPLVRRFEELLTRLPQHLVAVYDKDVATEWLQYHMINNLSSLGGFKTKAKAMIASNKLLKKSS